MKKNNLLKTYSNKTLKTYKSKKLNNANHGDFNLNDYQVFLHLISKIGCVDENGKYFQELGILQREHKLSAQEFSKTFHINIKNCYLILHKACKKLMKTSITVEKPHLNETWEINVCSMAKYNKKEGYISIKFTDDIMPYLLDNVVKRFTIYNLKEISNFGSLYTTRLYELIQDFKETGWLQKSVTELREVFATADKFPLYADLKKYTFGHACKEINNNYDMDLQFTEIKEGRKVVAIKFTFKKSIPKKVFNKELGIESIVYEKPKPKQITFNNARNKEKGKIINTNLQTNEVNNSVIEQEKITNDKENIERSDTKEVKKTENSFTSFLKRFF